MQTYLLHLTRLICVLLPLLTAGHWPLLLRSGAVLQRPSSPLNLGHWRQQEQPAAADN
jgi:hypothetical protein